MTTPEHKEYIVTVHNSTDLDDIYNELETQGCGLHGHFPDRAIDCYERRPNSRNTHYMMSAEEAEMIANDPRVRAVELHPREQGLIPVLHWTETSSHFVRDSVTLTQNDRNWGLLRCWNGSNSINFGSGGNTTLSGSVTVYASGTNVDVVMIDGLSNGTHPEFAINPDGTGGSRVIDYDWFANHNAQVGITPNSHYTYTYTGSTGFTADNNHGAHTAGTVAGNTQGWARNANIYRIDPLDVDDVNFSGAYSGNAALYVFDYVKQFHLNKPVNPETGVKNPTITNNSWGYSYSSVLPSFITSVTFRGTTYTTSTSFTNSQLQSWYINVYNGYVTMPARVAAVDADVEDAIAAGVIVVGSAGNADAFMDVSTGTDYNNLINGTYAYARGASPAAATGVINVGAIDVLNNDAKSEFSNCGPRVDLFAPGSYIMSSFNNNLSYSSVSDPRNASYRLGKLSGTSMASPQVTGIIACLLERHPTWTQTNIISYIPNIVGTNQMVNPGYSGTRGLFGAPNRFLKVPAELLSAPLTTTATITDLRYTLNHTISSIQPIVASDGISPYSYTITPSVPTGLSFNSSGILSGTPLVEINTTTYTVTVTDASDYSVQDSFSIYIGPVLSRNIIYSSLNFEQNVTITPVQPVVASGGNSPYSYSITPPLPTGLSFDSSGIMSGTPLVESNTSSYVITVTDSNTSTVTATISVKVAQALSISLLNGGNFVFSQNQTITPIQPITALYGNQPYTYSISPELPAGLSFDSSGILSGTPTTKIDTSTYTITIIDSNSASLTSNITIRVIAEYPTWITPSGFLGTITEYVATATTLSVSDYTYVELISGSLPYPLTLNSSTAVISGSPDGVWNTTRSQFVVRAHSPGGISDRTFIIDTAGPTAPIWSAADNIWLTTSTNHLILLDGHDYIINKQYVDFDFSNYAESADGMPIGQTLKFYIADGDGTLPPGLFLDQSGRLHGYITDQLGLDQQVSKLGGYDSERFDGYPYDHGPLTPTQIGVQRPIALEKIYQFYVTVSDGVSTARKYFIINVKDPLNLSTTSSYYIVTPQWVTTSSLGTIRADNKQVIELKYYDPYPYVGPVTFNWTIVDTNPTSHPPFFTLGTSTGILSAVLPYKPAFSTTYEFTVRMIKTDTYSGFTDPLTETYPTAYRDQTFTLNVLGNVIGSMQFVTTSTVGAVDAGAPCDLAIVAKHSGTDQISINYSVVSGSLPPGLSLLPDGCVVGKADRGIYDNIGYFFTVRAQDNYQSNIIEQEFIIEVNTPTLSYTDIYIKPLLSLSGRSLYKSLVENTSIFDKSFIYRPNDTEFGIQKEIKFVLEYGVEQQNLGDYLTQIDDYISRFKEQKFFFNGVKTAIAKDGQGNIQYEVVYTEIVDELGNGIDLMKDYFDSNYETDEHYLPLWMRTTQESYGTSIGFVKAIPICYTLPGKSSIIADRIALSGFDFKNINFTADRMTVSTSLDNTDAKYLVFPTREAVK